MKRIICSLTAIFVAVCVQAQMMNADDVKSVFSQRNTMANHAEYSIESILKSIGFDFAILGENVQATNVTIDDKSYTCTYNENGQLKEISNGNDVICKITYNSNLQPEVVNIKSKIYAITYDKKGRVASEAVLLQTDNSINISNSNLVVSGDYVFTDFWKDATGKTPKIYLQEICDGNAVRTWAIETITTFDYKGNGIMKGKIVTASNDSRNAVFTFSYDKKVLQQQIKSYSNNTMVESSMYVYENDKLSKVNKGYFKPEKKNPPLISSETTTMKYDSTGNLVEFTSFDGYRYDYCEIIYDTQNRIVKVQKRKEDGEMTPMFQCEYDSHNNVTKSVRNGQVFEHTYVYDAKGNWIVKTSGSHTIKRDLQYK